MTSPVTSHDCILPEVGAGQTAEMAVGIERKGVDLWETGEAKSTASGLFVDEVGRVRGRQSEGEMAATFQ